MKAMHFEVGDTVWYYAAHHRGEKTKGTVVMIVDIPGWAFHHYVIETPTEIEPLLEIRSPYEVSDFSNCVIGLMRG